jgi:hypothetical protein
MLNLCRGLLAQQGTDCGRLLVRTGGNQTAGLAVHQVDTSAGQAPHAYIGPLVASLRRLIVEDVLNVQTGCRASEDEWAYHYRSRWPELKGMGLPDG